MWSWDTDEEEDYRCRFKNEWTLAGYRRRASPSAGLQASYDMEVATSLRPRRIKLASLGTYTSSPPEESQDGFLGISLGGKM